MAFSPENNKQGSLRSQGSLALRTVLKQPKNIEIIEKYIHKRAEKDNDYDSMYNNILYQTIGDIIIGISPADIVNNIKKDLVGWNNPAFTNVKNRMDEHDDFIVNPFEVEEGVTQCKCGSERVFTYSKQVRSSDEPMTTFAKCVECKAQWTLSLIHI